MSLIESIEEYWAWCGIQPVEIVAVNDFANLMIKSLDGKHWRLCPEEVYCEVVADSADAYDVLSNDAEFIKDWNMSVMVDEATALLGALAEGEFYCLIVPVVVDGEYVGSNFRKALLPDIIKFSGELGQSIKDLDDGSEIKFTEFKS